MDEGALKGVFTDLTAYRTFLSYIYESSVDARV